MIEVIWRKIDDSLTPFAIRIKQKGDMEMFISDNEFKTIRAICVCFLIPFEEQK
jgi:hypothetical protein